MLSFQLIRGIDMKQSGINGQPVSQNGANRSSNPRLIVENVTVEFDGFKALSGVSFTAHDGSLIGVVGPNGAGKSTLFNVMAGLQPMKTGQVRVIGRTHERPDFLAYVPQREKINWRFPASVEDVVMLGRSGGRWRWFQRPSNEDKESVRECLERVDMWIHRTDLMPELSGGQRQRVFIARALAQEAHVLLLDESFSGVDVGAQKYLVETLRGLRDDGKVILMATHDLTNLAERFDQVLCLNHHVCAYGPPREVFTPAVLEELYGAHGVTVTGSGPKHRRHD